MYGITKEDIQFLDTKVKNQKDWILKYLSDFDFGENKTALDFTYSANLNPDKYFAEMNNRINSIFDYAKELKLYPVFVTLTAPSEFHKKDRSGNLKINPNDTAKIFTQVWNKFTNLQIFQRLRKSTGESLMYFRVYEPHKSSVPHMHAMLFLPKDLILDVKKKFYEYFTTKATYTIQDKKTLIFKKNLWDNNRKSIDFKYTWYNSAGGAISYIMKYVTKSFKNPNDKSIQHASYWYMKHNIRRFCCSRNLKLPITVYRKVRHFFSSDSSYLSVSEKYRDNLIKRIFNDNTYSYMRYNIDTQQVDEVILWEKNAESVIHKKIKSNTTFKLLYKKHEYKKALDVYINEFEKYSFSDTQNKFILLPVVASKLKDYQLEKYFFELNQDSSLSDSLHFKIAKNEMIKRGFLNNDIKAPIYEKRQICDLQHKKELTYTAKIEDSYNSIEIYTLTDFKYTEKEEYIDLETGEYKYIDVVKTIQQIGF